MKKISVYTVVPTAEAYQVTGKGPIGTRVIDVNKGDANNPNYRSRFVAMDFKKGSPSTELFAGMPPLEAKNFLLSLAVNDANSASSTSRKPICMRRHAGLFTCA